MRVLADNAYFALLRENADYRRLYFAQVVSLLGDWFEYIAVQTLVFQLTGSGLAAGLAIIASTLPSFFLIPLAGSFADRFDRRKIMIATDIIRGCLALSLLLVRTADQIWMVYLFQTLSVLFASFFNPALNAAIPNMVRRDQLLVANALSSATWGTMLAVGSFAGGVTIALLGRDLAFIVNAASFFVSAIFVWQIRARLNEHRAAAQKGLNPFRDFAEGFRYAVQRPQVFWLMLVKSGAGLGGGVILLLTVFSFEVLDTGATGVGILQAARGIGILVGPFLVARIVAGRIGRAQNMISIGFGLIGACYILFGLTTSLIAALVFVSVAHMNWGSNWTLSAALLQRLVPDHVRGRIFSMDLGLLTLTLALSTFLTGVAVDNFDARTVAVVLGVIFISYGALWTLGILVSQRRSPEAWQTGSLHESHLAERSTVAQLEEERV